MNRSKRRQILKEPAILPTSDALNGPGACTSSGLFLFQETKRWAAR